MVVHEIIDKRFPGGSRVRVGVEAVELSSGKTAVVLIELPYGDGPEENPGASVTNACDVIIPDLFRRLYGPMGLAPQDLRFFEHYPKKLRPGRNQRQEFHEIFLSFNGTNFCGPPTWRPVPDALLLEIAANCPRLAGIADHIED